MGDTTDDLLDAADAALGGVITIDAVEKLHKDTARELGIRSPTSIPSFPSSAPC
jgi:aspartate kinase